MAHFLSEYLPLLLVSLGALTSQLLMKHGVSQGGPLSVASLEQLVGLVQRILTTPVLLLGYSLSFVTGVVWLVVLARSDLSYALPLTTATYFVLMLLLSALVLGEAVSPWRWAGTLLILLGIALVSRTS